MELSRRLRAVAGLVESGNVLADIGTDHAYIPIFLVGSGRIPSAVAMDVNRGPLKRAEENIRALGYSDRISVRLSDGFASLGEGEAQSAVIAGMGGPLMIRILSEGKRIVHTLRECILQPQSEIEKVRAFLTGEGFSFIREDIVEEDGKYYPMMKVRPPSGDRREAGYRDDGWNGTELRYGKLLLRERHPVLKRYLEREIRLCENIIGQLEEKGSPPASDRRRELIAKLECAQKGVEYYAVPGDRPCH